MSNNMSSYDSFSIGLEQIERDIREIVYSGDLCSLTQKTVYEQLQTKYGIDLIQFKDPIYKQSIKIARERINSSPKLQTIQQKLHNNNNNNTNNNNSNSNNSNNNNNNNNSSNNSTGYVNENNFSENDSDMNTNDDGTSNDDDNESESGSDSDIHSDNDIEYKYNFIKSELTQTTMNSINNSSNNINSNDSSSNNNNISDINRDNINGITPVDVIPKKRKRGRPRKDDLTTTNNNSNSNSTHNTSSIHSAQYISSKVKYKSNFIQKERILNSLSKRDKKSDYLLTPILSKIIGKKKASWEYCWNFIINYATKNHLRNGTRKINCDSLLKRIFDKNEITVIGISRGIWKHLIINEQLGITVDENRKKEKEIIKNKIRNNINSMSNIYNNNNHLNNNGLLTPNIINSNPFNTNINDTNLPPNLMPSNAFNINYYTNTFNFNTNEFNNLIPPNINMDNIERKVRKRRKKKPKKPKKEGDRRGQFSGLARLVRVTEQLGNVFNIMHPLPRHDITSKFWKYVKDNKLKRDGRILTCDDTFKKLFGLNEIHMYNVQKLLKKHIIPMSKNEENQFKQNNPKLFPKYHEKLNNQLQIKTENIQN